MNIELTPAARLMIHVLGKLRAQRDALLSPLATKMVQHAQEMMNQAGTAPNNLIGHAWRTAWSMYPRTEPGDVGRQLETLVGRLLGELEEAIGKLEEQVPGFKPVSVPLPATLRDLDDLFAPENTRSGSMSLCHDESTETSLFVPVFYASMVPEAFRRIISAYRFEAGDFSRHLRAEAQFCDLAAITLPHLESYHDDLLTHDRDALYGMSVGQEGLVVVKEYGCGTWLYPTVGSDNNVAMCAGRQQELERAKAIVLVTYSSVTQLSPLAAGQYWSMASHRALAA